MFEQFHNKQKMLQNEAPQRNEADLKMNKLHYGETYELGCGCFLKNAGFISSCAFKIVTKLTNAVILRSGGFCVG